MAKTIESPGLVARIPIPPGYEEVEVIKKIRVPNKASVSVKVKELRRLPGISRFDRAAGPDHTVVTIRKPGARSVVSKRIAKSIKPVIPKSSGAKLYVKPLGHSKGILPKLKKMARDAKCTWCGKPLLPGNDKLHDDCAEIKRQLQQSTPTVRRCIACDTPLPANSHRLKKYCDSEACRTNRARQASRESYHRILKHTATAERTCIVCGDDISLLRSNRKVCLKPACKQELKRRGAYAYFAQNQKDPAAKQRQRENQRRYKANRGT